VPTLSAKIKYFGVQLGSNWWWLGSLISSLLSANAANLLSTVKFNSLEGILLNICPVVTALVLMGSIGYRHKIIID
jgi:hypothetical protein